jgi:hypothetical protein
MHAGCKERIAARDAEIERLRAVEAAAANFRECWPYQPRWEAALKRLNEALAAPPIQEKP